MLLNTIEAAASDLMYRLDVDGLQQIMDSIGQHPVVSGRIYDAQGRIIADATESQTLFRIEPDPFGQRARPRHVRNRGRSNAVRFSVTLFDALESGVTTWQEPSS